MLKPVYALVGNDVFLQLNEISRLLKELPPDVQRIEFDGEVAQLGDVLEEVRTFTMFASAKFVVVRSADDFISRWREELERYMEKPSTSATLVLRVNSLPKNQRIYKLIDKTGQVIPCDPPKDLAGWATGRAKQEHKIALASDAARLLVELIGDDLGRMDNELAKLALQTDDGKVSVELVRKSVSFQREQEMWVMTQELTAGRTAAAVQRWRQLLQSDPSSEFRATTWLTMWLEKVYRIAAMQRDGASSGEIVKAAKLFPPNLIDGYFRTAQTIGVKRAGDLIQKLAKMDYQSKTGVGDMSENVERFLLTVATNS